MRKTRFNIQIINVGGMICARVSSHGTNLNVMCNAKDLRELSRQALIKAEELKEIEDNK